MFEDTTVLIEWIRESNLHFAATKAMSRKIRNYYNGDQLDDTIRRILYNRGQPEHYENQIAKHNNAIIGFKQERDVETFLFGRQQRDRASADMLNATIKAITQTTKYDDTVDEIDNDLCLDGVACVEMRVKASEERDPFGRKHKDASANRVPPDELYLDPFSRAKNYNDDARHLTRCFWVDRSDLYQYPFNKDDIENLSTYNYLSDIQSDDLEHDETIRDRVLLAYTWYREYDAEAKKMKFYYVFWSDTTILLQDESPFDFNGFPYELRFLNRDFKGDIKYWGLYRDIIPLQDAINYAKLRLQNMLANNKTAVERSALDNQDEEAFRDEWNMDNALVIVNDANGIKEFKQNVQIQQILNTVVDSRRQISELLNTNNEMLGTANNRMSGVGQERRIETGLVGLSRFVKASDGLQKQIYHKFVDLIAQYYDTQRVVSIIDEDYAQNFIVMNEPAYNANGGVDYEMLPGGKLRPKVTNKINIGKYDLIYVAKPKQNSMSDERLRQNVELLKVVQQSRPDLVPYMLPGILRDSHSPDARALKARIEQMEEERVKSPQAQELERLKQQNMQLENSLKASQVSLNHAKAQGVSDRNRIDLQKAWSRSRIDQANVRAKEDKSMMDSMRRIR